MLDKDNVLRMTFEEYDKMLEEFNMKEKKVSWPSLEEFDSFVESLSEDKIRLCCFILEKAPEPKTKAEEYSKKTLNDFLYTHLFLE